MSDTANDHSRKDIDYHEAIAAEYDRVVVAPRRASIDALFAPLSARIPRGARMLDLGTGTGHMLERYAGRFDDVVAVDHSDAMLAFAREAMRRRGWSHVRFVDADATSFLRDDDGRYDLVTCVGFLHHLLAEQRVAIFRGVREHLAGDGLLVIAEPVETDRREPPAIEWWNRAYRRRPEEYRVHAEDPDEAPLPREQLHREFTEAGLAVVADGSGWEVFPRPGLAPMLNRWAIRALHAGFGAGGPVYWACCRRA